MDTIVGTVTLAGIYAPIPLLIPVRDEAVGHFRAVPWQSGSCSGSGPLWWGTKTAARQSAEAVSIAIRTGRAQHVMDSSDAERRVPLPPPRPRR